MEQSIQQLFLRYLQNSATTAEIEQVISLIKTGGYEEEWQSAMLLFEAEFPGNQSDLAFDQAALFEQIKSNLRQKPKTYLLRWIGYAASLFIILGFGYFLWNPEPKIEQITTDVAVSNTAKKISGRKWIKLPDGSSVQLNANSHLDYPDRFEGKQRIVKLTGEAYFDIKHDPKHPFIIHTGKIKTTVLGTAFNILSDSKNQKVTVTVTRGRVMVQESDRTLAVLHANQQLNWQLDKTSAKRTVNAAEVVAWKNQDLIMDDVTLAQAAALLVERYQLHVSFANDKVKNCRFTAAFLDRNDIQQVIAVLADVTGASFELRGKHLQIGGDGCTNTN